jgi:nitrogen fixation NifU-like protein
MSETLYHDALMAEARRASGHGRLADPDLAAMVDNPLCGDRVRIELQLADGRIAALAHEVKGCVLCKASASLLAREAVGLDRDGVAAKTRHMEDLLAGKLDGAQASFEPFRPVAPYRSRHDCVLLPFRAVERALAPAEKSQRAADAPGRQKPRISPTERRSPRRRARPSVG